MMPLFIAVLVLIAVAGAVVVASLMATEIEQCDCTDSCHCETPDEYGLIDDIDDYTLFP